MCKWSHGQQLSAQVKRDQRELIFVGGLFNSKRFILTFFFLSGSGKNTLLEELKNNERENLRLIAEKV